MQVKIFTDFSKPSFSFFGKEKASMFSDLESKINEWFDENPDIKIHKIEQKVSGGTFFGECEKLIVTIFMRTRKLTLVEFQPVHNKSINYAPAAPDVLPHADYFGRYVF